jgi:hypothetical protein
MLAPSGVRRDQRHAEKEQIKQAETKRGVKQTEPAACLWGPCVPSTARFVAKRRNTVTENGEAATLRLAVSGRSIRE